MSREGTDRVVVVVVVIHVAAIVVVVLLAIFYIFIIHTSSTHPFFYLGQIYFLFEGNYLDQILYEK